MHTINKTLKIKHHQIKLLFNDNSIKWFDLEQIIKSKLSTENSLHKQLLNEEYFKTVKNHPKWETIYWDNGMDFCPDTLYKTANANDRN